MIGFAATSLVLPNKVKHFNIVLLMLASVSDMAYQRLTTAMNGHIEELLMSINNKNESFVSQLKKTQNSIPSL